MPRKRICAESFRLLLEGTDNVSIQHQFRAVSNIPLTVERLSRHKGNMRNGIAPVDPASLVDVCHLPAEVVNLTVNIQCSENLVMPKDIRKHSLDTTCDSGSVAASYGEPHPTVGQIVEFKVRPVRRGIDAVIADALEQVEITEIGVYHIHAQVVRRRQHGGIKIDHIRVNLYRFKL